MTDYRPNLREIACVLKHKAHLALYSSYKPCRYCGSNIEELAEAGEPVVVVWDIGGGLEAEYIIPDPGDGMNLKPVGKSSLALRLKTSYRAKGF